MCVTIHSHSYSHLLYLLLKYLWVESSSWEWIGYHSFLFHSSLSPFSHLSLVYFLFLLICFHWIQESSSSNLMSISFVESTPSLLPLLSSFSFLSLFWKGIFEGELIKWEVESDFIIFDTFSWIDREREQERRKRERMGEWVREKRGARDRTGEWVREKTKRVTVFSLPNF